MIAEYLLIQSTPPTRRLSPLECPHPSLEFSHNFWCEEIGVFLFLFYIGSFAPQSFGASRSYRRLFQSRVASKQLIRVVVSGLCLLSFNGSHSVELWQAWNRSLIIRHNCRHIAAEQKKHAQWVPKTYFHPEIHFKGQQMAILSDSFLRLSTVVASQ